MVAVEETLKKNVGLVVVVQQCQFQFVVENDDGDDDDG